MRTIARRIIIIALFFGILAYTLFGSCRVHKARGVEDFPRKDVIAEIKKFEKRMGYRKDENFHPESFLQDAYYICYSTGRFFLPYTYFGMSVTQGKKGGCNINPLGKDVFVSKVEGIGRNNASTTRFLTDASLERFITVIVHEDYHEEVSPEVQLSSDIDEAAATMMGLAGAIDFAREKYGEDSEIYKNLFLEPAFFMQKAVIVNKYYVQLKSLYADFYRFQISEADTLNRKRELFNELQRECGTITPQPKTFNACPAVLNNAGLALDITYTRHFPRMYEAWIHYDKDSKKLFDAFQKHLPRLGELMND